MSEFTFSRFENIFYDGDAIGYPLGGKLHEKYFDAEWIGVEKHSIRRPLECSCESFKVDPHAAYLTVRGREPYYPGNHISDFSVPFTSAIGYHPKCKGKCFYIYVNREEIMIRLLAEAAKNRDSKFEVGEFSDLVAENRITGNLPWVIDEFAKGERGFMTFTTSFSPSNDLLSVNHKCRTIIRIKINPEMIINSSEPDTSPLGARIHGINKLTYSGYPCGIVLSPVIICENWRYLYGELFDILEATLCDEIKKNGTVEIIFDKRSPALKSKKLEAAEFIIRQSLEKLPLMKIIDIH
ncbi:MAG: hypothetical protein IJE51_05880 [Clostridia bacterium]|nr:hypothetical protein [Clostridia bacterium]